MASGGYMSNTKQDRHTRENDIDDNNINNDDKRINKLKKKNNCKKWIDKIIIIILIMNRCIYNVGSYVSTV